MYLKPLEQRGQGECPSGYSFYSCNGFRGCCSVNPCNSDPRSCPAESIASEAGVDAVSTIPVPGTSTRNLQWMTTMSTPTSTSDSSAAAASIEAASAPISIPASTNSATAAQSILSNSSTGPANTAPATPSFANTNANSTSLGPGALAAILTASAALLLVLLAFLLCRFTGHHKQRRPGDHERRARLSKPPPPEWPRSPVGGINSFPRLESCHDKVEHARRSGGRLYIPDLTVPESPKRGEIENPQGGTFEELGGRYFSPDPESSSPSLSCSWSSKASSIAESALVSPLTPNPARLPLGHHHRRRASCASNNPFEPRPLSSHPISRPPSSGPVILAELDDTSSAAASPGSPTFGLQPPPRSARRPRPDKVVALDGPAGGEEKEVYGFVTTTTPRATPGTTFVEREGRGAHVASWGHY